MEYDFEYEARTVTPNPDVTVPLQVFVTLFPLPGFGQVDLVLIPATGQTVRFEDLGVADRIGIGERVKQLIKERVCKN